MPTSLASVDGNLPAPIMRYRERVQASVDERIPDESLPLRLAMVIEAGRPRSEDLHSRPRRPRLPHFRRTAASFAAVLVLVIALSGRITPANSPRSTTSGQGLYTSLELIHELNSARLGNPRDAVRVIVFRGAGRDDALWLIGQTPAYGSSRQEFRVIDEVPRQRGTYLFAIDDPYAGASRSDTLDYEALRNEVRILWVMRSSGEQSAQKIDRLRTTRTRERTLPAVVASRPLVLRAG